MARASRFPLLLVAAATISTTATTDRWSFTSLRHRRDHMREFSCGRLYYRTFYMDRKREVLFVGGMDKVFRLNLMNINRTKCNDRSLTANSDVVSTCVYKGKREDYECRNHIKVIQPIGDGSKLYVCGTNAQNPRDLEIFLRDSTEKGHCHSDCDYCA